MAKDDVEATTRLLSSIVSAAKTEDKNKKTADPDNCSFETNTEETVSSLMFIPKILLPSEDTEKIYMCTVYM